MAVDPLSPIAPARIRALLLPVGRIKRSRFLAFVELLQTQCLIRLGDISPDSRPDRNMFSPLAFPNGTLLYDLSTSLPPQSQLSLSPFEQFREPLLVIGIADATEYSWLDESRADDPASQSENVAEELTDISTSIEDLREQFPRAYLHSLMMFDYQSASRHPQLPQETILVPPRSQLKTTTIRTFMCDLTSVFLAELTTLAKSIQALPTVPSPATAQNGTADAPSSWTSSDSLGTQLGRRNSQIPSSSRPDSPGAPGSKEVHRMSMPVLPSTAPSSTSTPEDPRSQSPTTQGARTPPTTFDDIAGVNAPNPLNRTNSNPNKSQASSLRDSSSDRFSIQGFGSGGVGERARNKGRGRVSIVIGTLYLSAGLWHEAIGELVEGATRARAFSDHLWHAKALENILVCLLLFAWAGMDFQIPQLCYPISDKSSGTKSPQHTPSSSVANIATATSAPTSHEVALESLNALIPDLVNMILNIYNRASNFSGESLPPLAHSECVIRFSKLLAAMNLSAGSLDFDALQHLVQSTPLRQKPRLSVPRLSVNPTRNDIANLLFRALPAPESTSVNPTDRVVILAGIASILSSLGLQRKKAIVMKEFITSLIPGLVQARKVGAAEMGVHPAAGLAALNMATGGTSGAGALNLGEGEVENGIDQFLGLLGRIYGIPDSRNALNYSGSPTPDHETDQSRARNKNSQAVVEEILQISSLRAFGSLSLKLDILRMCIGFCEALPDFNGVIHFTALLLRMAGPGTAPKANSTDVFVSLTREEQARLYGNISKTVAAAARLGLQQVDTEYWDDFLVRGIFIVEEPHALRLTHHRPIELKATSTVKESPFIHNPWIKQPATIATETILVAEEKYKFVIALQNPYDFELGVDYLKLAADGVEFDAHEENFVLGPYRTQKFPIVGIAKSAGELNIIGCLVKVTGCRERLFPIFPEPWKPERESKMKKIGLKACLGAPVSRPSSAVAPKSEAPISAPKPQSLSFSVIPDQPVLTLANVSLPQESIMVLEGESRKFSVTLHNTSPTATVDFVHISFRDSATAAMQAATSNKDLPAAELHELEYQLAHLPSLRWCKDHDDEDIRIKPGEKATFQIEVTGRARLTDAVIQFDYANLGKRRSEIQDTFFTRQLSVPISITVNASVQLQRPDIVPLSGDFAWSGTEASSPTLALGENSMFASFLDHTRTGRKGNEYCMVMLDLRNSWPNPLEISLQASSKPVEGESDAVWSESYSVTETIQPGHVNRAVIILPKIYVEDPHAPIPSLNPANQRQFVVSASKLSPDAERLSREAFWYRHELLKHIRGTWKEGHNGRHGEIELRGIRLSARMIEATRLDDIFIETTVVPADGDGEDEDADRVRRAGHAKFQVEVDEFLTLKTTIHNRSSRHISPLLRLQPHVAGLPHNIALDLDKRFSWTGVLQRKLPAITPGQSVETELGIVALCSGVFEIGAVVDEVELLKSEVETTENRARSGTATLLQGNVLGDPKLGSWYMKEPCTIVAKRAAIE
ncbi:hypercellular protein-like protein HypA [Aaosphaeria arxii CBS 175.79]|uniref:Hypercellular protein-like protein HypA n=1 Tax=Aaosphaeria arxii CBS 175.79 TaxID=1450172 RepID=A0A6A5XU11_9PLEO|nr:hypercellular protein-like protein HypA [Aaosphaeria arxii CBS 175.79]KAF2016682.1 hypercellular protein-like protein HypA [Aaosphaeria arxii CBS 175.79]